MTLEMVTVVKEIKKKHVIQLYQYYHILKQLILKIGQVKKNFLVFLYSLGSNLSEKSTPNFVPFCKGIDSLPDTCEQ